MTRPPNGTPGDATGPGSAPRSAGELEDLIARYVDDREERLIKLRRRMHATPEASGQERETTHLVAETLRDFGYEPKVMADDVGVIVDIDLGAPSGTRIALRSELDCVGVNDDKQAYYASTHPGLCHACGHDAHTTILLAVAGAIAEHRDLLSTRVFRHNLRLVFQPSEETATGARSMIKQGALDGVEAIIAVHVDPTIDAGSIGLRNGALTSAAKAFHATVRGRSGHSARPFEAVDPIPGATSLVGLFYQLGPRSMDSRYPLALTVASIQGGSVFNAIPDQATVAGTLRASRLRDMEAVQKRMHSVAKGVAESTGCEITLEFVNSTPATDNDPDVIQAFADIGSSLLGRDHVQWLDVPSLGGEDFAFYQELIPGAIIRLGAALEDIRSRRPLHSSLFDINETALAIGAKVLALAGLRLASSYGGTRP
ncbi:MAG: amidohydrolase [Planctomycetes bacterium]|nr:amidohydrolase [Planctomycetota bacterium]